MHLNVLSPQQAELLPLIRRFRRSFYLVGGTAIALHIGHRRSIDFDLFTAAQLSKSKIRGVLREWPEPARVLHEDVDQLHVLLNHVKLTFFQYPYDVPHGMDADGFAHMPDLLTLAAMKAFALGRRAKWKDYVDLYFLLTGHHSIERVSAKADELFGGDFSGKLFREQLCYFDDVDYTESVDYLGAPTPDERIRERLIELSTRIV
jgi:hypothetical protein